MRTIRLSLALLLLLAGAALAQVPRTINYQGRARSNNVAVTGNHQMTLSLYATLTGGTPLFTETASVDFTSEGIFTVAIGAASGGIPASVPFDREYWLGVKINGVNGGQELAPRLILRSSPYSIRAITADSALVAETAHTFKTPAAVVGFSDPNPLLDVSNGGSIGFRTGGSQYGIVSTAPDSTSHWFVAGSNAGTTGPPVVGAYYRDNAPMAWGLIDRNGKLVEGFGIVSVTHNTNNPGVYEIVLANPAELFPPTNPTAVGLAPVITPGGQVDISGPLIVPAWINKVGPTGVPSQVSIVVYLRDALSNGRPTDQAFSIAFFGRPE
jgi:hypothetical protein